MATLGEFAQRMRERGRAVEANSAVVVRKVALRCLQTLATGTPVDTGRARSNWQVSVGSPLDSVVAAHAPAPGRDGHGGGPGAPGSTGAENTRATLEKGGVVIGSYQPGGNAIYIANNLPYIERLNQGWSAQAPAAFVEKAVQDAVAATAGARLTE